ncbi:hypothetical protein FLK61_40065 [Paenalkalicoccus suaedae]|uniref:Uncharacterized protein n=1 Tax=Paenalkalicoccus suaedae TaxID=2592382 RepID=A0A859FIS3_9BACI|nr:hypothetical protein [Paenalkalicoccus suaedae]QKS72808.1 hypothetical protein FLK61_40065 [Paenalkalicoccus suaedae]
MKKEWQSLMDLKGKDLTQILGDRFNMINDANEFHYQIMNQQFYLYWILPSDDWSHIIDYGFIKFGWENNNDGDHILLSNHQKTPGPLPYELSDNPTWPINVQASSISPKSRLIKNVTGYGYDNGDLFILLIETEEEYISIVGNPVLLVQIADHETKTPEHLNVIFTTKVEEGT